MSVSIPAMVKYALVCLKLCANFLKELFVGKVRHTYELPDYPGYLLVVASDRISIFDFVLNALIPKKGEVLVAMTVFWLTKLFAGEPHHLVAYGAGIDQYLPAALRGNHELQRRAMVVRRLKMLPVEAIPRGYLTGSYWRAYVKAGGPEHGATICDIWLPAGLRDGDELPEILFTVSTKAEAGDVNISYDQMVRVLSDWLSREGIFLDTSRLAAQVRDKTVDYYERASGYTRKRGIVLADTKFEFGLDENNALTLTIGDEVFTPDSSRFWDESERQEALAAGKQPPSHDKEGVRTAGKKIVTPFYSLDPDNKDHPARLWKDIPGFDPQVHYKVVGIHRKSMHADDPEHVAFVAEYPFPAKVLTAASGVYQEILERLLGKPLEDFQKEDMKAS